MEEGDRVVKWRRPPVKGAPPPGRGGHTGVSLGNLFITFGGTFYGGSGKFSYLNEVRALDTETMTWHKPTCAGRAPGARYGHAAAVVGFCVYIFGGKGEGGILYNDLWRLNVEKWAWEHVPTSSAAPPSARFGHAMLAVGEKLLVHGGWDGKHANSETWLFDIATLAWTKAGTTGAPPSSRHGHSCVFDEANGRMLLVGGWHPDAASGMPVYLQDMWQLDLRTLAWSKPRIAGDRPGPRYAHAVATVGNVMVLFGGYDGPRDAAAVELACTPRETISVPYTAGMGGDALAGPGSLMTVPYGTHPDTFLLDLDAMEWIQPAVAGRPPLYRYGAAAACAGAQVLLFGGWEGGRPLNELLVLDMSGLVNPLPSTAGGGGGSGAGGGDYDGGAASGGTGGGGDDDGAGRGGDGEAATGGAGTHYSGTP